MFWMAIIRKKAFPERDLRCCQRNRHETACRWSSNSSSDLEAARKNEWCCSSGPIDGELLKRLSGLASKVRKRKVGMGSSGPPGGGAFRASRRIHAETPPQQTIGDGSREGLFVATATLWLIGTQQPVRFETTLRRLVRFGQRACHTADSLACPRPRKIWARPRDVGVSTQICASFLPNLLAGTLGVLGFAVIRPDRILERDPRVTRIKSRTAVYSLLEHGRAPKSRRCAK